MSTEQTAEEAAKRKAWLDSLPAEFKTPEGEYSTVRENLMTEKGYSPYCGSNKCFYMMPRTTFNGEQFTCKCGWKSGFEKAFIDAYKKQWNIQ